MRIRSCFLLALLVGWGHGLLGDVVYSVTNLGTLGGSNSFAFGLNNSGQVTGGSATSTGAQHAFLYSNGQMTDLGTLGGATVGYGINDAGQVAGSSETSTGATHAFL